MRGVLYRTDEDGNPLETPELKVSAINGSNIKVYANQEAKNAALENGDIKPGDVVLSGGTGKDAPIEMDWANKEQIYFINNVTTQEAFVTVPKAGQLAVGIGSYNGPSQIEISISGVIIASFASKDLDYVGTTTTALVNKGDVVRVYNKNSTRVMVRLILVPYKEI